VSGLSTHVLDLALGRPAAGVPVRLEALRDGAWAPLAEAATNADGRVARLLPEGAALVPGDYRLTFDTAAYFAARGGESFYPAVAVAFTVRDAAQHYHVPLLLSPFGYSTYRGS
jgi:5-hydroxyisourate hydrolase